MHETLFFPTEMTQPLGLRINRTSTTLRAASVTLIALISLANAWSSGELIKDLVNGVGGDNATLLLARGASVYVTNILVFALWYWEWDSGGPVARARALRQYPDFLFPQMTQPDLTSPDWEPTFLDYLYVSFTNATAFSPTSTGSTPRSVGSEPALSPGSRDGSLNAYAIELLGRAG